MPLEEVEVSQFSTRKKRSVSRGLEHHHRLRLQEGSIRRIRIRLEGEGRPTRTIWSTQALSWADIPKL